MKDVIDLFRAARRVSTPLVAISTADQFALARRMFQSIGNGDDPVPKITWDIMRGLQHVNEAGATLLSQTQGVELSRNPASMLEMISKFPAASLIVMYNAHRFIDDVQVAQGILNLRDSYCENRRTLVMVGPSFQLPAELQDVVLLDEALPSDEQLNGILQKLAKDTYPDNTPEIDSEWVDAVRGLSAFASEQVFAMSMNKEGIDRDDLWERKQAAVNQTRGLKFTRGGPTFEMLGGLESFKTFVGKLFNGPEKPGCIVFMDEVEKALAGATGQVSDSSGVSQDFLGTLLSWMEDNKHDGMIAVGMPGTGKTAGGMSIGATFGQPTITLDAGGMKGSLVGESERAIREALKVIDSIAGHEGAFVFATCNREASLPPEFKRRFRAGTWFFDLPTQRERQSIWNIHLSQNALKINLHDIPPDDDWTGAEIRNCCELARRLNCSLDDAAQYVIPVAHSNKEGVEQLRRSARNWLSASYPGAYRGVDSKKKGGRKVAL